jgi:ADP-ribose pyrophosphatase YjhB (NUDIX family)
MYELQKAVNIVATGPFQSLTFRGKRGYSNRTFTMKQKQPDVGTRTYGGILVTEKGKYALVQGRYTGKWSFPKGHANPEESPIDCSMREIAEETSITHLPQPTSYLKIGYGSYFVFNLKEEQALVPRDTHEIMDTKWVTLEEMGEMKVNADVSMFLRQQKNPT